MDSSGISVEKRSSAAASSVAIRVGVDGIYKATGGAHASFLGCTINSNLSRRGTMWFDSTLCADDEYLMLSDCVFDLNQTIDGQYGATAYCTDAVVGRHPLLVLDRCQFTNGNGGGTESGSIWYEHDVRSNYEPDYRVLRDITEGTLLSDSANMLGPVGTAANGGSDLSGLPGDFNGDGVVDGIDLAILLAAWGDESRADVTLVFCSCLFHTFCSITRFHEIKRCP